MLLGPDFPSDGGGFGGGYDPGGYFGGEMPPFGSGGSFEFPGMGGIGNVVSQFKSKDMLEWMQRLGPLAATILGGTLSYRADAGRNDLLAGYADILHKLGITGLGNMGPLIEQATGIYGNMSANGGWTPEMTSLMQQMQGLQGSIPSTYFNQNVDSIPGGAMDRMWEIDGQYGNISDIFNNVASNRGQTADTRELYRMLTGPTMGMQDVVNAGHDVLAGGGRNFFTDFARDNSVQGMNSGGFTPGLQTAEQIASRIAASGGRNADTAAAVNPLLDIVRSGGETATTRALANRGLDLANREALLPLGMVLSQARDNVGRTNKQAAEAALRMARARGGDAAISTGDDFAPFAEGAAANEANALREAMLGQQALQLQQQGQGLGAAGNAAQAATSRLNVGTGGLSDILGLEAGKTNQALGALSNLTNSATNRLGTFGNIGLGAEGLVNNRLNTGANLVDTFANDQARRAGLATNLLGLENSNMFNAGNLVNSILGNRNNNMTNLAGVYNQNGQLNLGRANGSMDAQGNMLALIGQLLGAANSNQMNGAGGLANMGQIWGNLVNVGYGGIGGLLGNTSAVGGNLGNLLLQGGAGALWPQLVYGGRRNGGEGKNEGTGEGG